MASKTQMIAYASGGIALVWVFHDASWPSLMEQARSIGWLSVCLIVLLDVLSFCVQGVRWSLLLRSTGDISALRATQAIYVGLLASEFLPLRAGELVRGALAAAWLKCKFWQVVPSIALERLFDSVWFSASLLTALAFVPLPREVNTGIWILVAIAAIGSAVFFWALRRQQAATELILGATDNRAFQFRSWLRRSLFQVLSGFKQIGTGRNFVCSFLVSGILILVQGAAFVAVLQACDLKLSVLASIAVFLIVHLGISIPNAPANLGTFHLFCVVGLTFFGVDKASAAAVSAVTFAILTVPLVVLGGVATVLAGISISDIHSGYRRNICAAKDAA